jgi:hypothetical protein
MNKKQIEQKILSLIEDNLRKAGKHNEICDSVSKKIGNNLDNQINDITVNVHDLLIYCNECKDNSEYTLLKMLLEEVRK